MNIVITGGSKGIGKAIAERFAAANHNIFVAARTEDTLRKTCEEISKKYPASSISYLPADLSWEHGINQFADWINKQIVPDVLVNNAGTFLPGSIYDEPQGTLEQMIQTNLYSAYHLTRKLLPGMMDQKKGHIINICSIASLNAYANGGSYSISKYALMGFSKNLREEMKPFNILVSSLYPGAVYTDSWKQSGLPESRFIPVEDVATLAYTMATLSERSCVEDLIIRPMQGDI